jgi:hypothetical protein
LLFVVLFLLSLLLMMMFFCIYFTINDGGDFSTPSEQAVCAYLCKRNGWYYSVFNVSIRTFAATWHCEGEGMGDRSFRSVKAGPLLLAPSGKQ